MSGYPRLLIAKDFGNRNSVPSDGLMKYPCLVDLPDPKTQQLRQYLVTETSVQECNAIQRGWSMWLIGNSVIGDGTLYAWTPVNIVFLLLEALGKAGQQGTFCSIDHILECMEGGNDIYSLLKLAEAQNDVLKEICDWKENEGVCFFKLNNEKLLDWLKLRVNAVATDLAGRYPSFASITKTSVEAYSIGLVSEYLPDTLSEELFRIFGLEKPSEVREFSQIDNTLLKKEQGKPKFDKKKQQKLRAAAVREEEKEKKRKKETAGMQKLTSFFGKK